VTRTLIERLEATSAGAARRLVAAATDVAPEPLAEAVAFGRGALIAMGTGRYVNRAIGISLDELGGAALDRVADWYRGRQLPTMIEVSAWAARDSVAALAGHGYTPAWFRAMFVRPCDPRALDPTPHGIEVVAVESEHDAERWRTVFAAGFSVTDPEAVAVSDEFARIDRAVPTAQQFLALIDGVAVGCCSVTAVDGVAWLGATATLPDSRGRGVQRAMVRRRLAHAEAAGCDLAAATALPDGASARNLARLGFTLVQHQVVMAAPGPRP